MDRKGDKGSRSLRALAVLETVAQSGRPMTVADIMAAANLPKATVHRLCALLGKQGYLQRDFGGRGVMTGPKLDRLVLTVLAGHRHRVLTHAILENLVGEVRETCNLNVPDGAAMLYVDRVEAQWPLRMQLPVGTRVPLHCTASGKLYLAMLPEADRKRLLKGLKLERQTPNTKTDFVALEKALADIRAEEVGIDDEEFLDGMVAVAVPVKDGQGRVCATLAMHGPTLRISIASARRHIPTLRRAAADISEILQTGSAPRGGGSAVGRHS
jgi:DNA-binding IclR family transcriptional regulator